MCEDAKFKAIIHYCWFGGGLLTETAKQSLASWDRFAPGFEIKRWDESNSPINDCDFVRSAYEAGRWAFVADYVRFWVLYHHGGIYMDVGSELIKDISPLMRYLRKCLKIIGICNSKTPLNLCKLIRLMKCLRKFWKITAFFARILGK